METPSYVKYLLQDSGEAAPQSRRVWGIDLQTVWIPFFTATNVKGETSIPAEDLGAPLRVVRQKDGALRFSDNGRPNMRVVGTVNDHIRKTRENFVASLLAFVGDTQREHETEYMEHVVAAQRDGGAIIDAQTREIAEAERLMAEAQAQQHGEDGTPPSEPAAEGQPQPEAEAAEAQHESAKRRKTEEVAA